MASILDTLTSARGPESAGFLNDIVAHLWPNICVAGGKMIKDIVEPMFESMLPGPLKSLHFEKIDLGLIPMRFDNVAVTKTDNGGIKLDLDLDWNGNCDIELNGNMIPKIGVEHVKLRGRLSVLLCPLTNIIPLIGAAQVSFIDQPYLKLSWTDGAHIANLGIIDSTIRKVIHTIMAGMVVLPNRFLVKLDSTSDWFKTYQPQLGMLKLTIQGATDMGEELKSKNIFKKLIHDVPDCYAKVNLGAQEFKTQTVKNNHHPEWNETQDFWVSDTDQTIEVDIKDDDTASDDDIGIATTTVKALLLAGGQQELGLTHKGEATNGKIKISAKFYHLVADASSFSSPEAGVVGQLTVLVASALNIDGKREQLKPSVKVTWGANSFRTPIKLDAPGQDIQNPSFDQAYRVPIPSGTDMAGSGPVKLTLMDGETEKGSVDVSLQTVLEAPNLTLEQEFSLNSGAKIRAALILRGIKLSA
ncbi:hypothetical protein QBC35DRAFT_504271 [Podospora australis]|uniref:C2 domain-containing protein n=1 Tax=Podospora australis TaxID=1536484 RepID=A0AAN6WRN3_9PEZI|nr:hypothetical protein QBC35DRAFT_504271 [Podospora australis]